MNSFLQSHEWEKFQNSVGRTTFRVSGKLVIKNNLPFGKNYLYAPRPYFNNESELKKFIIESQEVARSEKSIFLRLEPDMFENFNIENSLEIGNWKLEISKCIQPQDTLLLNLKQSEEDMQKNMHQKTRYNIRLAEKHGITIKKSIDPKDIDTFFELAQKTSARDNFSYHEKAYYKQMLKILGEHNMVQLLIAYTISKSKNNKITIKQNDNKLEIPTAAAIILYYKDTAIYLHGASDHNYRNLMSPYLLQWEAIKEAKKRGCKSYDFYGVAPEGAEHHAWAGVTRFKTGFIDPPVGERKITHYPNSFDLIYQPIWYRIYTLIRKIRTGI